MNSILDFFNRVKSNWTVIALPIGIVMGLVLYPMFFQPEVKTVKVVERVEVPVEVEKIVTLPEKIVTLPGKDNTKVITLPGKNNTKVIYRTKDAELNACLTKLDTAQADRLNALYLLDTLKREGKLPR